MPTIDARYVPWISVAILIALLGLNIQGAIFLSRKANTSVWVENDSWLKDGERVTVDESNASSSADAESYEAALRSVLNDCTIGGRVIMDAGIADTSLRLSCFDPMRRKKIPLPLPTDPAAPEN